MSFTKTIHLPTGTLEVNINQAADLFNQYVDFAARNNPKRGFLFVSKVLGKHYPCKPSVMQQSYQMLARLLLDVEQHSQQFVFIGMAETATALGLGIYESWLQKTNKQGIYSQTTRYFLADHPYLNFQELHTYAKDFYLYIPEDEPLKQLFHQADTLVLIDDEISTGNTFANLINAYKKINPFLKRVIVLSLLNLMEQSAEERINNLTEMKVEWLSILTGSHRFTPNPEFEFQTVNAEGTKTCRKNLVPINYGRLGISHTQTKFYPAWDEINHLLKPPATILVLGTGEFIYHAFQLGRYLEQQGFVVYVQSTTRSPILVGGAIGDRLSFTDNYGDGITNFLYNSKTHPYDHILLCHETPKNNEINNLLNLLNATSIRINDGTICISRP